MTRAMILVLAGAIFPALPASAQEWAEKMFSQTRHDFGTIARGSRAEYEFVLQNSYLDDVHVASVHASCGCTSVKIAKPRLKTYEQGAIVARINSDRFLGRQGATITVTIDEPMFAQVQLDVRVYVQSDLVLQPAGINLGDVPFGTAAEKTLSVTSTRGGDWKILDVESGNPQLSGEVTETGRRPGRVSYRLRARLAKDAPPGYFKDHLLLVTGDPQATRIPVLVEGRVVRPVSVSPSTLFLGVVQPGAEVTKQVVVRGNKPFRVTAVTADGEGFRAEAPPDGPPKPLHLLPVTFTAGDKPGRIVQTIRIGTDLEGISVELSAYAVVGANE